MDGRRFDDFARRWTVRRSRRAALVALFGGAAGGLVHVFGGRVGMAATCGRVGAVCPGELPCCGNSTCRRNRCRCRRGFNDCGGRCFDLDVSNIHCGACGNRCGPDRICREGTCVRRCRPDNARACGYRNCGDVVNNCNQVVSCGECTAPETCGGGMTPGVCGCTPNDVVACQDFSCGEAVNNCGQPVTCGTCDWPWTCDGGTSAGRCRCPSNFDCGEFGTFRPDTCSCVCSDATLQSCGHCREGCRILPDGSHDCGSAAPETLPCPGGRCCAGTCCPDGWECAGTTCLS